MCQKFYYNTRVDQPLNNYNIDLMRFCCYGEAYMRYRLKYENDYVIDKVSEITWENDKTETKTMIVEITLARRK